MHKALHFTDDKLYVSRKERRRCTNIEDNVDASIRWLEDNIKRRKEWQMTVARNSTKKTITRKQKWEEKQMYEYFKRQTSEISHEKTWK